MSTDAREGGLTVDEIRTVIQRGIQDVQLCYEAGIEAVPGLRGRVRIVFDIQTDGHVGDSRPEIDTTGHPETAECIAHVASAWIYPRPQASGVVVVRFPFSLWQQPDGPRRSSRSVDEPLGDAATWVAPPEPLPPHSRSVSRPPSLDGWRRAISRLEHQVATVAVDDPERQAMELALVDARIDYELSIESANLRTADSRAIHEASSREVATFLRNHPTHPDTDRLMYALGHSLVRMGRPERAEQVFLALADRWPRSRYAPHAHAAIGRRAYLEGRYEEARVAFRRAASTGGTSHEIQGYSLVMLGASLARSSRIDDARSAFESAGRYLDDHPEWTNSFRSTDAASFAERRARMQSALSSLEAP